MSHRRAQCPSSSGPTPGREDAWGGGRGVCSTFCACPRARSCLHTAGRPGGPACPLASPQRGALRDRAAPPWSPDSHQGHDPHPVQVLGSTAGGRLGGGVAAAGRGRAGQGQGGQGGGDGAAPAQLGQAEGLGAAAAHTRLDLLLLLLDCPGRRGVTCLSHGGHRRPCHHQRCARTVRPPPRWPARVARPRQQVRAGVTGPAGHSPSRRQSP